MVELNGNLVEFGVYPNGELNLPISNLIILPENTIKFVYEDNIDFIRLALLKGWVDDMNGNSGLYIAYMPYSRMDRANGHYAVSLKAMCNFINSLNFNSVTVREPHSKQTLDWLNNAVEDAWCLTRFSQVANWVDLKTTEKPVSIFFPDYGAKERYSKALIDRPVAYGKKKRDFLTGDILGLEISGDVEKNVLIVDDLCSRGGTFISAAKELKKLGAENISLLVAYCEDNVFTGEIFNYIDTIYTSNERELKNHPQITKIT